MAMEDLHRREREVLRLGKREEEEEEEKRTRKKERRKRKGNKCGLLLNVVNKKKGKE